jgi:hypothetical protein
MVQEGRMLAVIPKSGCVSGPHGLRNGIATFMFISTTIKKVLRPKTLSV